MLESIVPLTIGAGATALVTAAYAAYGAWKDARAARTAAARSGTDLMLLREQLREAQQAIMEAQELLMHRGPSPESLDEVSAQEAYIRAVSGGAMPADQIAAAKRLLDSGTITSEEFARLKVRALE